MNQKRRVLFYFMHLLGVGHVYRAQRLIQGFADANLAVDVIYGGEKINGVEFAVDSVTYLPAIKAADNAYTHYLDEHGNRLSKDYRDKRTKILLNAFETLTPDLILTEAFPFGRRMVRHELKALFDAASLRSKPPIIVSSVRDILQERKKVGRNEETRQWIDTYFDRILVHSDPKVITLNKTFPLADAVQDKLAYTGFVVPETTAPLEIEPLDIVVSAGGGAFGGSLLTAMVKCARNMPDRSFLIATGPNCPEPVFQNLKENAPPNTAIVNYLNNLSAHMKAARISISQCGYNTAMDALAARENANCKILFVPYDTEGQTEQLRRAELLAEKGFAITLPQSSLTAPILQAAIQQAEDLDAPSSRVDFSGTETSARLISEWIEDRQ